VTPAIAASLASLVGEWVARTENLRALALLGSWARDEATPQSDLDLLVLAMKPGRYCGERPPLAAIGLAGAGYQLINRQRVQYGVVTSQVLTLDPEAELELSFAGREWAELAGTDPGTASVIRRGFRILVDKDGMLRRAAAAVAA